MKCSCINTGASDNGPLAFKETRPKAHKQHICCECKRVIEVGEVYAYENGIWDFGPKVYKTCPDCLSIRKEFFCDGHMYTEMWRDVRDHIDAADGIVSSECIQSLTPLARDKVFEIMDYMFSRAD